MGSGVPASICFRTAAGVRFGKLEGLENRADDGTGERGAHPLEGRGVLLEERRRIDRALAAGGIVFLAELHAGILPEHLVGFEVAQLDARGHDDRVAGRQLLRVEARWDNRDVGHLAVEQRVDAGAFRERLILSAADELGAYFFREQRFEVEDGGAIEKRRDADRADVIRQERAAPCQGIPARRRQTTPEHAKHAEKNIYSAISAASTVEIFKRQRRSPAVLSRPRPYEPSFRSCA